VIVVVSADPAYTRLVTRRLLNRDPAEQIAVVATASDGFPDLAESGVSVRPDGVDVFRPYDRAIVYPVRGWDPSGRAGADVDLETRRLEAARDAGVIGLVHVGIISADRTYLKWHLSLEGAVRGSGIPFTILREGLTSEALVPAVRLAAASGQLICSFGGRFIAPAARADYAQAAAIVLQAGNHEGRTYGLTGLARLTAQGLASVVPTVDGQSIEVRDIEGDDVAGALRDSGADEATADYLNRFYANVRYGEWSTATDDLGGLLGRPPTTLTAALADALSTAATQPPPAAVTGAPQAPTSSSSGTGRRS
jgi:NAD(P)H dehydrogenase (quinone)